MQVDDFNQAIKNTLQALTFSEKALAQGLFYSQQYDGKTRRSWVRAPTFTLSEALAQARDVPRKAFKARFIEIYCDTLTVDCPISPEPGENDGLLCSIQICARTIVAPPATAQAASLVVNMLPGCNIALLTPRMPPNFEVAFVVKGKANPRIRPVVDAGQFGVYYSCDSKPPNSIQIEQLPPPDITLESIDYLSLIKPDGTVQEKGFLNDDFPRLLQMQLLVAQANSRLDRNFAIEVLNYVVAASATPYNVYLNYQACSLRNTLLLDTDVMAVSSVNIYSSKQVLKARLQAALAFEASFRDFSAQSGNAQYQVMNAINLLAKSSDAIETYGFLLDIKQRDYDTAVETNKKAGSVFKANQAEVSDRTKDFQADADKFKRDEERKAIWACILGVVEVVGAIATTVATGGATAPAVVAAGVGTAQAVGKVAALVQKLKAIFAKLKEIYEKIKPVIEKLQALVETAKTVIENLRKLKEVTNDAQALKPDTKSNDVINATAEWRRFNLEVTAMEESLRDYNIESKPKFFLALKKLVINGETFILAQANLVQKGDELATVMLQRKMEGRDKDRLSAMVYNISATEKVLDLLRRAMFDRLLAIRGMVYLDFSTYCSAYSYHTLRRENVISLSPVKPVVDFLEDAATLQGAVVSFGSRVLIQSRKFVLQTLCGYDKVEDLAAELRKGNPVEVTISPNDSLWEGFSRVRMSAARCYLEGVQTAPSSNSPGKTAQSVRLQLSTDGRFFDIQDSRVDNIGLTVDATQQSQKQVIRSFVGDARRLLFDYQPSDGTIICDGLYGQERDYTKHTPITTWNIALVGKNGASSLLSPGVDFTKFSGVRLEFTCEVVWSGY